MNLQSKLQSLYSRETWLGLIRTIFGASAELFAKPVALTVTIVSCTLVLNAWGGALGRYIASYLDTITRNSDVIAELEILSSTNQTHLPDGFDTKLFELYCDTLSIPHETKRERAGPYNGYWQTIPARVITALKGCETNEIIQLDFDDATLYTAIFSTGQRCLVFLRRFPNQHCVALSSEHSKSILNNLVVDWQKHTRSYKPRAPVNEALQEVRECIAANVRDDQLCVSLIRPPAITNENWTVSISNRGPESVCLFGPRTAAPWINVAFTLDKGLRSFMPEDFHDNRTVVQLPPGHVRTQTFNINNIVRELPSGTNTLWVEINSKKSNRIEINIAQESATNIPRLLPTGS